VSTDDHYDRAPKAYRQATTPATYTPQPAKGFRVTIEEIDTGQTTTMVVAPGDYFLATFEPCHETHHATYANGVASITIKGNKPEFTAYSPDGSTVRVDGDAPAATELERRRE
jgi:hypothetical protein